jgi:hypothetical protein
MLESPSCIVALVDMSATAHGKGSLLIHTANYVRETRGEDTWTQLVASSPPADREVLQGVLLAGSWYPIGIVNRIVATFCDKYHRGTPQDEMRRLSAHIADSDLGTVYKMALRFGSPEFLLRRTDSLWNRYFDVGKLTPTEVDRGSWRLTLTMPYGDEVAPNQLFCGPGCPAWIEMGLKLTGAKNASVRHVECRAQNGTSCTYSVSW